MNIIEPEAKEFFAGRLPTALAQRGKIMTPISCFSHSRNVSAGMIVLETGAIVRRRIRRGGAVERCRSRC